MLPGIKLLHQGRSQIRHKYYNGMLELTLPKKNGSTALQLQVK